MKILQVNVVYRIKSTGKIVADIHDELKKTGYRSIVCYSRAAKSDGPDAIKLCGTLYSHVNAALSRLTGIIFGGCLFSTNKLISIVKKEKPDIVHLHCLNGYFVNIYRLMSWLKKHHQKTILTLHAEFMHTGGCGYALDCDRWKNGCGECPRWKQETGSWFRDNTHLMWQKMSNAVKGFDELEVIAVSEWLAKRAAESGVFKGIPVKKIHNGIMIDTFFPMDEGSKSAIREKYNIPKKKKIVLNVTPRFSDVTKGGALFSSLAKMLPKEYQAVIVGCDGKAPDDTIGIHFVDNQKELAALYSLADIFVITSKVDNYPTVCLEANCCGTPVVGFDVGGIKETIGEGMGETVPPYNLEAMLEKTIYWSNKKSEISSDILNDRRKYCDKVRMSNDYIRLYKELIEP